VLVVFSTQTKRVPAWS